MLLPLGSLVDGALAVALAGAAAFVLIAAFRLRAALAGVVALLAFAGAGASGVLAIGDGAAGVFLAVSGAFAAIAAVLLGLGRLMEAVLRDHHES